MSGLLAADVAALESAHRKLEGMIGTQRLRAAEKAFAAKLNPSATATRAAPPSPAPSPVAELAPSGSTSEEASIADTLALVRAAGIAGYNP